MRTLILGLTMLFATPAFSTEPAAGWSLLGEIAAQVDGEKLDLSVLKQPDGTPHAFQIDAGGVTIVSAQGYVLTESGELGWPSLDVSIMMVGAMAIVQEVQFYKSGGSNPEMWMMQEGMGRASISGAKLTKDGKFTGTLDATLHRWNLAESAEIAGEDTITITAEISSQAPPLKQ